MIYQIIIILWNLLLKVLPKEIVIKYNLIIIILIIIVKLGKIFMKFNLL